MEGPCKGRIDHREITHNGRGGLITERLLTMSSSMDQKRWNWSVLTYQSATGFICRSGWFPTTWSTNRMLVGGL